jgi:hypothetical protein
MIQFVWKTILVETIMWTQSAHYHRAQGAAEDPYQYAHAYCYEQRLEK